MVISSVVAWRMGDRVLTIAQHVTRVSN